MARRNYSSLQTPHFRAVSYTHLTIYANGVKLSTVEIPETKGIAPQTTKMVKSDALKLSLIHIFMKPMKEAYDKNVLSLYKNKAKFLTSGLEGATGAMLGASAIGWNI